MPRWLESKDFEAHPARDLIRVDAFDENRPDEDYPLGSAEIEVDKLLRKRSMVLPLKTRGALNGANVTLQVSFCKALYCVMLWLNVKPTLARHRSAPPWTSPTVPWVKTRMRT